MSMSASIVSQEKNNLIVLTFHEETQVLFQAAREELLMFPPYATLPIVTASEKVFFFFSKIYIRPQKPE